MTIYLLFINQIIIFFSENVILLFIHLNILLILCKLELLTNLNFKNKDNLITTSFMFNCL